MCVKPDAVYAIRSNISTGVRSSCSNSDDVDSTFAFHYNYCDLIRVGHDEFSGFTTPESPSGDSKFRRSWLLTVYTGHKLVSYYVIALIQYGDMEGCAQAALSSEVQQVGLFEEFGR